MTSRAGQSRDALLGLFGLSEGDRESLNEIADAIEQEVRDDIRARVEATGIARMLREPLPWDGHQQKLARKAMQEVAAISSSSATEKQEKCRICGGRGAHIVIGHETILDHTFRPPETPDRDDRDREVDRIAAVLAKAAVDPVTDTCTLDDHHGEPFATALYDAGLRASGGD